jgi:threonyl-tRNA synthetase
MLVVGDKEEAQNAVAVRPRQGNDLGMMKMDEFLTRINKEIEEKK